MVQFLLKLLLKQILAVHHDFHCFNSQMSFPSC